MKTKLLFLALTLQVWACAAQTDFSRYFEDKSLRIDFALSGNSLSQSAALIQMREEPIWSGPKENLIDTFGYGAYYVNLYEATSGELLYTRGFNTLFEEWRTTDEAGQQTQSWYQSISVPYPRREARVQIMARDNKDMAFREVLSLTVDPSSIFIDRGALAENKVVAIQRSGDPSHKVDLVFLAEGYTAGESAKFEADARRFTESLFSTPPFDGRREDFNVWAVCLISQDSGVDYPGKGIYRNTALNSGFYTFGIERYLTTRDVKAMRDAVWNVPCDALFILANTERYGGGGMYNFYAIGTSDNAKTASVFVHELGHSFAGLGDEYFTSEVAYNDYYNLSLEPWEPNITTLVDFDSKWKAMLPEGVPVPTPVSGEWTNSLGVFEGGGYVSKGVYRPSDHCMMRDYHPFCPVCSKAIMEMIDFLTDKQ